MSDAFDPSIILKGAEAAFVDASLQSSFDLSPQFVFNDYKAGQKVIAALSNELDRCTSFFFSVAFITQGGIAPLLMAFDELSRKGVVGKILTTDYLTFSDPRALRQLGRIPGVELKMYRVTGTAPGFHTKCYGFERPDGTYRIYIGSSNLTARALAVNNEWNVKFASTVDGSMARSVMSEFERLWEKSDDASCALREYEAIYHEKQRKAQDSVSASSDAIAPAPLAPNSMRLRFIDNLERLVRDGAKRALLVSATGTGKTYASAFALRHLNASRILFLAHREQVLRQAMKSYRRVFGIGKSAGLLSGTSADRDSDLLFATMQTMSKDEVLNSFVPDAFDMIVIDEVHRAGSKSYQKILDYFRPKFCLGMTASPDRPDGFDIYALFDNNIAHEIRLQQALEEDLLCPFHYFGIVDYEVDGEVVDERTGLRNFNNLVADARVEHVLEKAEYYGFSGDKVRGLVFCSTNNEARVLAEKFADRGYRSIALSGADPQEKRLDAIRRLEEDGDRGDALDYIFTVDIFNEGVDIPAVNQVIMLRPTESPIVFVQQLGRGLRKSDGKEYVVVLDFIGNYVNNYMIPVALSGDRSYNKDSIRRYVMEGDRIIPGCSSVHFDSVARQRIFHSIDSCSIGRRKLKESYYALRHKLGRIPSMVDFLDYGEIDPMLMVKDSGSYAAFLKLVERKEVHQFSDAEMDVLHFVSNYIANGMRPHELIALRDLVEEGECSRDELRAQLQKASVAEVRRSDLDSAIRMLDMQFVNSSGDKKRYASVHLLKNIDDPRRIEISGDLKAMVKGDDFRRALLDVVEFGLARYREKYTNAEDGLVLYEKYSRKDVCRLLNWESDDSSTMYGYRVKYGTCPIFVTYNKADDISASTQYEDKFIDAEHFSWMSRSRLTLDSPEIKKIISAKEGEVAVYLFVKKSDGEGSDFYYLGRALPKRWRQCKISDDNGKPLDIVNFDLKLDIPVREDIYEYLRS